MGLVAVGLVPQVAAELGLRAAAVGAAAAAGEVGPWQGTLQSSMISETLRWR